MTATNARAVFRNSALLVLALGVLFGLLFGSFNYHRDTLNGMNARLSHELGYSLVRWLSYALLAPAVGLLVSRAPLERGRLGRRLPLHLAVGLAFASVHNLIVTIGFIPIFGAPGSVMVGFQRLQAAYLALNFAMYCGISGVYHAIHYRREIHAREQQAAEMRIRLTEARLEALRAQLNPHFLFNTLNAVSALALTGQKEQVVTTLSNLSDLLRVSLDRDLPQEIPLARELGILRAYLDIQGTRFGDRLRLQMDIEDAARAALLPSMILQPLVENALTHGLAARPGPGHVSIRARRDADRLRIRVEDTGPGFRPAGNASSGNGIGLSNTRERLEQLYGPRQRLAWGDGTAGGAFVELEIPYRPGEVSV